jgi:hypothetical protein
MTAIEKALELRDQAITILLAEREQIDLQLAQLGYGQEKAPNGKRRGRPAKQTSVSESSSFLDPQPV